jgi:hypothetical protein
MVDGGVRIDGLNQVVRGLQELGLDIEDLKDAFAPIAARAARYASSFAPRRTGALAASIRPNRSKNKAVVVAGKARVPYAGVINYGWARRNISPSSFMQKADERMRPLALQMLDDAINAKIRERGLG